MAKRHIKGHSMNNKILLGAAISLATLQVTAQPFAPTDARGMAMGGTGVASAKTVHSVQYNPSLLSGGDESDDFGLLLPQVGGYFADEDEFIDNADAFAEADYATDFTDAFNAIETSVSNSTNSFTAVNTAIDNSDLAALQIANASLAADVAALNSGTGSLRSATGSLTQGLSLLSGKPLRGGLGGGAGIAIPSKKFSVAISANNSTSFSGQLNIAQEDLDSLNNYTAALDAYSSELNSYSQASSAATTALAVVNAAGGLVTAAEVQAVTDAQSDLLDAKNNLDAFSYGGVAGEGDQVIFTGGALDPNADTITLKSEINIVAIAISEVAISISREFTIADRQVAIGITPKLQRIDAYNYKVQVEDDTETSEISELGVEDTGFNLDIGASTKFGAEEQGTFGVVIKNLIGKDIQTTDGNAVTTDDLVVSIAPQIRVGVAYQALGWVNLAADLDITENEPVAFEDATQFLSLGAEADVLGFLQLRAGYRSNLASSGQNVMSAGLGLSPFGIMHIDIGGYANTSDPAKEAGVVFELGLDW